MTDASGNAAVTVAVPVAKAVNGAIYRVNGNSNAQAAVHMTATYTTAVAGSTPPSGNARSRSAGPPRDRTLEDNFLQPFTPTGGSGGAERDRT